MSLLPTRAALFLLAFFTAVSAVLAQDAKPALTLESVKIEPAAPGPDTLCKLTVTLRNTGSQPASALEFTVKVGGQDMAAYKGRTFLKPVEPGATREIALFKFWSTEPSRPAPADGMLAVDVTLAKASWMTRETKDGAEAWTLASPVEGLPATKSVSVNVKK